LIEYNGKMQDPKLILEAIIRHNENLTHALDEMLEDPSFYYDFHTLANISDEDEDIC